MRNHLFYFTTQRTGLLPLLHKGPGGFSRPEYRLAMLSSLPGASPSASPGGIDAREKLYDQPAPILAASWRFALCTAMVFSFLHRVRRKGSHRRVPAYLCGPGLCPRQRTGAETGGAPVRLRRPGRKKPHAFCQGRLFSGGEGQRKRKSPRGYGLAGFALCITGRAGTVRPLRAAVTAR